MKGFEAIAMSLKDQGVTTLFGLIGDANLYMVDCYIRDFGGRYIAATGENAAALMALGHAAVTNDVGVATITHGPALTNTITALVEGVKGEMPMVLLAGDTDKVDKEHGQNVPQREFVIAAGAGFEEIRSTATIAEDINEAFRRARVERRPIVLNVPAMFQWEDVEKPVTRPYAINRGCVAPTGTELENVVAIIASAKRPIIIGGRGMIGDGAPEAVVRLANRIGAVLATTLKGKGLFHGEPSNVGIFGSLSFNDAAEAISMSDCVIAFGASLNRFTTVGKRLLQGKRVIQINHDMSQSGRFAHPDATLVGHPGRAADRIVALLDEAEIPASGFAEEFAQVRAGLQAPPPDHSTAHGTVHMSTAMHRLEKELPTDRILVTDGGRFLSEVWREISVSTPGSFVFTNNFGAIGLGLAQAIGASAAANGRTTLLVSGDGGFMLSGATEFNTAVREKMDLVVVICNDRGYGAEFIQFRNKEMDPAISLFDWPDFAPVAEAMGGYGVTVRSEADLDNAAEMIRSKQRPLLIDLKMDPDRIPVNW